MSAAEQGPAAQPASAQAAARAGIRVILNPTAGGGRAGRMAAAIARELETRGLTAEVVLTREPGHAVELAADAAADHGLVVAAGGDGTVHEVANGLLRVPEELRSAGLAVLPIGTGNDFVKLLGGARLSHAFDCILAGTTRPVDAGRVTWTGGSEYFINAMGTGIDVEVVRQIARLPRVPGLAGYLLGVLRALRVFHPIRARLTVDGTLIDRRVMIVAVGNGVSQGGGFYITPDARADDGRLDLCIIAEMPMTRVMRTLPRLFRGRHVGRRDVAMMQFSRLELETDEPLFFQLDGELREPTATRRLVVEVVPAALRVAGRPDASLDEVTG
ncbi:MAG TPA: diacylglycerol kinase family protein [Longimicrobiales bacterium]|nr:diacylglycerol kinase family protein [Longimicrobiales bacterium]